MKSTLINQITHYWIFHCPHKIGIVSLELSGGQYGLSMLSTHLGVNINDLPPEDKKLFLLSYDTKQSIKELFKNEDDTDRFFIVEDRNNDVLTLKKKIEQLIISCNCKVIIIDPLQDVFSGASLADEQQFMSWQKVMIKAYGVMFVNVCHTRKTSGSEKAGSVGGRPTEESIQGSSDIYKSAAVNIMFRRNKLAEDPLERNRTYLDVTKNRWNARTGPAGSLVFDPTENRLYDYDKYVELHPEALVADCEVELEDLDINAIG